MFAVGPEVRPYPGRKDKVQMRWALGITQALTDYIRYLRQDRILAFFGKVEFDPDYDYKRERVRA